MQWRGRRESGNVVDRRGMKTMGTLGGGGIILAILYALLGGDPSAIVDSGRETTPVNTNDDQTRFLRVVLADTEDVWNRAFQAVGRTYQEPKLVLFSGRVQSACGMASSAVGPFYCPGDQRLYLDTDFFQQLAGKLGAQGDFAQAYVIAHEVGHHVQQQLGLLRQGSSVATELQADCLAGYWARSTQSMNQSLEPGDVEEAMNAASSVGDDALQQASQGYVVPDSFTHGSSKQRMAAFRQGFEAEDFRNCDTNPAG
ncbi:KPN_02809 family neutral zinc metallopeptidase [Oligoflexus tunisiensis]|uniref:KPN_02809 family neutral zinc metallopeptidase n=1 Tax=Oligoflexus tunisiensis TaxID=708132 RepID=UPI000B3313F9|nr:neutral zinc metallopeptidase [Oligoflexus tunisiensis]